MIGVQHELQCDWEQLQTDFTTSPNSLQVNQPLISTTMSPFSTLADMQGDPQLIHIPSSSIQHSTLSLPADVFHSSFALPLTGHTDKARKCVQMAITRRLPRLAPRTRDKIVSITFDSQASDNNLHSTSHKLPISNKVQVIAQGHGKQSNQSRHYQNGSKRKRGRPGKRGETCIRCKLRSEGCQGGTPCDRCKQLSPYAHICVPADFAGKRLFGRGLYAARARNLLQHCRWIPLEQNSTPIYVKLTNGFPFTLRLQAQQFVPLNEEPVRYCLFKGLSSWEKPYRPPSSPYGLVPGSLSNAEMDEYLDNILPYLIEKVIPKDAPPSALNRILLAAFHHMNDSIDTHKAHELPGWPLIQMAFRIWIIHGIFFDLQNQISEGGDQIGVIPLQVPGYFNNMRCPPRLLNIQLEAAFEERMDTLEQELLCNLQKAVHQPKRGEWLSVFFATFLFLISLEKDSWNLGSWSVELNRAGGSSWPLGPSGPGPKGYGDQNQTLANMLSIIFRVRCQGSVPLKLNWNNNGTKKLLDNDEKKVAFMKSLGELVCEPRTHTVLETRKNAIFDRNDKNSLELMFASKLLLE